MKKLLIMGALLMSCAASGQPDEPGESPDDAPIDGGVSLLIVGAIGYGAKKVHDAKKQMETQKNPENE